MVGVAGWYKMPFGGSWPLFCEDGTYDVFICLFTVGESTGMYGFVPYMVLHSMIFYLGVLLAVLLRKKGYHWDKRSFKTIWDVGNHFPNLILCVPMGIMSTAAAYNYWLNGDAKASWGENFDMRGIEVAAWFGTYLVTDGILGLLHKTMDKMMFVHHFIFIFMCLTHFWPPNGPGYSGSVMMAQEISTPFLNSFLLCRGFLGDEALTTKIAFGLFAVLFFLFRVIFNTVMTVDYFVELNREITTGESGFDKTMPWLIAIGILFLGGCGMQLYFFKTIARKVYSLISGKKKKGKKQK